MNVAMEAYGEHEEWTVDSGQSLTNLFGIPITHGSGPQSDRPIGT